MKLRSIALAGSLLAPLAAAPRDASAGGLFLPGSGAVSTSRGGAAVASADDGEALGINPAGLAKSRGTTITISAAIINYSMEFTRRGTYDATMNGHPYEGQPYPTIKNDPDLPLGFAGFQPIPVIAVVSDLGGAIPGLHVAAGMYAPNAYPFRDMTNGYEFNGDPNVPPPPTRYDIMKQEASVLSPSIAAAYRINDKLDIGARFTWGISRLKSQVVVWGQPANYEEDVGRDSLLTLEAGDSFVPAFGLGATYRPTPKIELGVGYNSWMAINAKGEAYSRSGSGVSLQGQPITIGPRPDDAARCAPGGTFERQKACVTLEIPMTLNAAGRYKFLDGHGQLRGDVEVQVGWENWGAERTSNYQVVIDSEIYINDVPSLGLQGSRVRNGLQDTFSARVGGSYHIPLGDGADASRVILRGGASFDTRAARDGWLRASIDGAARVGVMAGGAYRARKFEINVGAGAVLEGSPSNSGTCNPTTTTEGCAADGSLQDLDDRRGPDPINPTIVPENQLENPVNQGDFKSHYLLFMLGVTTWF